MADNDDQLVREAFTRYATDVLTRAPQPNQAAVRRIVRRRHDQRITTIAAVFVLILVLPLAMVALLRGGDEGHRHPPLQSPSPSRSVTPSPTSAAAGTPGTPVRVPDGAITIDSLSHSTFTLAPLPSGGETFCPSGQIRMDGNPTTLSSSAGDRKLSIDKVVYTDVDGDGAAETVALLNCYIQAADQQVIVFDRDRSGAVRVLGRAVATSDRNVIRRVFDLRANDNGSVDVEVGDRSTCCGADPWLVEHQWRTFTWTGTAMEQTAGPGGFHAVPPATDLSVTAPALQLGALNNGSRHGSLAVTLTNKGPTTAAGVLLTIAVTSWGADLPAAATVSVDGVICANVDMPGYPTVLACHLNPLAIGATRKLTIQVAMPAADDAIIPLSEPTSPPVGVTIVVHPEQPGVRALADPAMLDNECRSPVTRAQ